MACDDFLDLSVDAGEVGVDDVAVDIDDRSNVVVGDGAKLRARVDGGDVAENLHGLAAHRRAARGGMRCRSGRGALPVESLRCAAAE